MCREESALHRCILPVLITSGNLSLQVEFRPPAIGSTQVPIRITGPGTIELRDDGLHVGGARVALRGRSAALLVAILLFTGAVVWFGKQLDTDLTIFAAVSGGLLLLALLRMPAKAGKPIEQVFPWANIKRVSYDGATQCVVVMIKGMKPKGGLFIVQPPHSELERSIAARLAMST